MKTARRRVPAVSEDTTQPKTDINGKSIESRLQRKIAYWKLHCPNRCLIEVKETTVHMDTSRWKLRHRVVGFQAEWQGKMIVDPIGNVPPKLWERMEQQRMLKRVSVNQTVNSSGRKTRITIYELVEPPTITDLPTNIM